LAGPHTEYLNSGEAHQGTVWNDKRTCARRSKTPGCEGREGARNVLCYKLAQITGAKVRASTATQIYDLKTMDFGSWEGTVLTYGPTGSLVRVEHAPTD